MAYEILQCDSQIEHRATHDLESLFYVLIWICVNYTGPRGAKRKDWDIFREAAPLGRWLDPLKGFGDLAETKLGQFTYSIQFETKILAHFHSYFEDLKLCCEELRKVFYAPDRQPKQDADHLTIISILEKHLKLLKVETPSKASEFDRLCNAQNAIDPFTPLITCSFHNDSSDDGDDDDDDNHDDDDDGPVSAADMLEELVEHKHKKDVFSGGSTMLRRKQGSKRYAQVINFRTLPP